MKVQSPPDIAVLNNLIEYNPETGHLTWRIKRNANSPAGKVAGTCDTKGYRVISIMNKSFKAHRLAWFISHGEWPQMLDHINGDKDDNRLANLRTVTPSQNACNRVHAGTSLTKRLGKWRVVVRGAGVYKYIGHFPTKEEASAAYARAVKSIYGEFASPHYMQGALKAMGRK